MLAKMLKITLNFKTKININLPTKFNQLIKIFKDLSFRFNLFKNGSISMTTIKLQNFKLKYINQKKQYPDFKQTKAQISNKLITKVNMFSKLDQRHQK